jgi:hypothetical protein
MSDIAFNSANGKRLAKSIVLVNEFVNGSVQQHLPIPRYRFGSCRCGMRTDVGGTIAGNSIVELRSGVESVNGLQVIEKYSSCPVRLNAGPIKVELFMPVVSSDSDHITLVGDDVNQIVLFEKTANGRVALTLSQSCLNRDCHVLVVVELKTDHRMTDQGRSPKANEEIDCLEVAEVNHSCFPARLRCQPGFTIEVPEIMNGDFISVSFCPGRLRDIRLPIAGLWRFYRPPPKRDSSK